MERLLRYTIAVTMLSLILWGCRGPVSKESAIIIKTQEDLMIAESLLKTRHNTTSYEVKYDALADVPTQS